MRTARSLSFVLLVSCCLSLVLTPPPAMAQGEVQFRGTRDMPLHPIFGAITDDPGPFKQFVWPSTVTNQFYIPQEDKTDGASESAAPPPVVQFNPVSGYPIAVWTAGAATDDAGPSDRGADVLFTHFRVGGWSEPVLLAEGGADPSLAIDPVSGRVHLVFWTPADGGAVWHRQAPADLSSWSAPVRVSDRREAAARPVLLHHGGKLSIAYERHLVGLGSSPREIVLAEREGTGFVRTALALTSHEGRTWVRLDSDGDRLLVRWVNAEHQAGWILRGDDGTWGTVQFVPLGLTARSAASRGGVSSKR
jgi:hypothetical protein